MDIKEFNDIKHSVDKIDAGEFKKEVLFSLLEKYKIGKIHFNGWNNTVVINIKRG